MQNTDNVEDNRDRNVPIDNTAEDVGGENAPLDNRDRNAPIDNADASSENAPPDNSGGPRV